jgi:hypothetical protein
MNTCQKQVTYNLLRLVLGLVCHAFENLHRPMRLAADRSDLQMRYPINFVVKHRNLPAVSPKASPEAVETRQTSPIVRSTCPACFQINGMKRMTLLTFLCP